MDSGRGYFEEFKDMKELKKNMHSLWNKHPNHGGVFEEGEELVIKGSRFRVSKIIRNGLKLELLPKE